MEDIIGALETGRNSHVKLEDVHASMEVVLLHSTLEMEEQLRVFSPIAAGVTRVVLATNIAESSVTIPAVRYVVCAA